jgi:hypothetical protein
MQVADKIIMRPVEALIPYARNARTHSDAQVAQIAGSIREFGFTNPIRDPAGAQILADLPGGGARGLASRKREAFEPSRRRAGVPGVPGDRSRPAGPAPLRPGGRRDRKTGTSQRTDKPLLQVLGEVQ